MTFWKVLGLAGAAGVAATGVAVVRAQRRRSELTPEEVRSALRARYAEITTAPAPPAGEDPSGRG